MPSRFSYSIGLFLVAGIIFFGGLAGLRTVTGATTKTHQLTVPTVGAPPTVSAVVLNHGNPITLTANATTSIDINFTVTDNDGCTDVFANGNVTSTAFRTTLGSSCTEGNLSCYRVSTSTHDCQSATSTSADATATIDIYYFAQATDASSSFPSDDWTAHVVAQDSSSTTGSATSSAVELNTLTAIDVTTPSINYGNIDAGTDTGSTNQITTSTNAGNSSTTLQLRASATLTSGSNSIATSSQHYATSTFTFGGSEQVLSENDSAVDGFSLVSPTSTSAVSDEIYWGLSVPAGTPNGTYTGTNVFSSLFQP